MTSTKYGSLRSCIQVPLQHEKHLGFSDKNLQAAFIKSKIWPSDSIIRIQFIEKPTEVSWTPMNVVERVPYDPIEKIARNMPDPIEAIKYIILERIQPLIGLKLVFVDQSGDIRIGFNPAEGAFSLVGTDCIQPNAPPKTMNLGWLDAATIIHEFGHALGMIHEHQNPNGVPIPWNVPVVLKWAQETQGWDAQTTENNIIDKYNKDEINGSDFDPQSIMLYFFPGSLTTTGKGTSENRLLSKEDVAWLGKIYPGGAGQGSIPISSKTWAITDWIKGIVGGGDEKTSSPSSSSPLSSTKIVDIADISSSVSTKSLTIGISLIIGLIILSFLYRYFDKIKNTWIDNAQNSSATAQTTTTYPLIPTSSQPFPERFKPSDLSTFPF